MYTIDEFTQWAGELADELPECFFERLNGGVIVKSEAKAHEKSRADDLFILGEYHNSSAMGRSIFLYYGSFIRLFGDAPKQAFVDRMRKTLRHEFRHHLESLSGERDLEVEDAKQIAAYLARD